MDKWTKEDEAEYSQFELPSNTLGLHKLYEPKDRTPDIDVVAVHGLGGDSFSTWTGDNNYLWLKDALPRSRYFLNARILTYGYDARAFVMPFAEKTTGRIFTFGEGLLSAVRDRRVEDPDRPLIFIGHSLGGIVMKSALVRAQSNKKLYRKLLAATKAIYFFGTPHQGADIATWATYLGSISKAVGIKRATVTKELVRWSNALVELTTLFSGQISDYKIKTFFETQEMYGIIVVPEGAATLGQANEDRSGLTANHRTICKYGSFESVNCQTVLASLGATKHEIDKEIVGTTEANIQKLKSLEAPRNLAKVSDRELERRFRALPSEN